MHIPKILAGVLAIGRAGFGVNYLLRPEEADNSWIGRAARKPGTQVIARSQGARDIALGAGTLRALARGEASELRAWVAGQAFSDLADFLATWIARNDIPGRQARLAMIVAGGSAVVGGAAAAGLRPRGDGG
jgi:hypothetical protein